MAKHFPNSTLTLGVTPVRTVTHNAGNNATDSITVPKGYKVIARAIVQTAWDSVTSATLDVGGTFSQTADVDAFIDGADTKSAGVVAIDAATTMQEPDADTNVTLTVTETGTTTAGQLIWWCELYPKTNTTYTYPNIA